MLPCYYIRADVLDSKSTKFGTVLVTRSVNAYPVPSLPALGPWAPPAERGPSLESIYPVSLTVDLCEG